MRPDLLRHYTERFRVLKTGPNAFNISRGGKREFVSVDRLKRVHMEHEEIAAHQPAAAAYSDHPQTTVQAEQEAQDAPTDSSQLTRRGRAIRPPTRLRAFEISAVGFQRVGANTGGRGEGYAEAINTTLLTFEPSTRVLSHW